MTTISDPLEGKWPNAKLGHVARVSTGSADLQDEVIEGEYPFYVRSSFVRRHSLYTHDTEAVLTAGDGNVGDIYHHAKGKFAVHQRVYVIEPGPHLTCRYLYYAMHALFLESLQGSTAKSTVESLRRPMLTGFQVPLPPLKEQQRIADYLDRETAEIDALIAEQVGLRELLSERFESDVARVISGKTMSEKDQLDHFFHELPETWRNRSVKSVLKVLTDGAHISPETEGGVYPFVSTRDISSSQIDTDGALLTSPETYRYMVRTGCQPIEGDVLFSKDGTVGTTAVVGQERPFVAASSLVILRPESTAMDSHFLEYALQSNQVRSQAAQRMRGAGLPRISVANVGRLRVPQPPISTQREIVSYLDGHRLEYVAMSRAIADLIALAKERRAALISAAVTGKIDVTEKHKSAAEQLEDGLAEAR
ncbi:MAG: restriction endonuclease subunit S [Leucobacter sp.]|uniref:Type I restriction-modification system, specificity subunit S n=1 Tax=Agrococcus casei LMG 22410 TaxID=1255656 RepID=A0A1R4GB63_9MICO|nr:restriction endonuclease subunit S [Agrococcus casei]SJM65396.1 Type I restriction-modification system, specificity subunit S [Agrococcus casei LMG 22410]